jgi:glycosylphosphatidylinositol transamidase (GPIT) subunit GPI8/ABC-type branched-subunit amino acid transport system substrate-binding protein
MSKIRILFATMLTAVLFVGCKSDDDAVVDPSGPKEVTTINVDVVLPASIRSQWQSSIDWALANINKAQQQQSSQVRLNLRYHDEDTENLDKLAYKLTHPEAGEDTCHAIIGPYHSSNARDIIRYAGRERLPIIMPTCTSSELQRSNARNTYTWFLTESDVTQCEMMVTGASKMGDVDVALIYSDDTYGQSFRDWFGYYATERQLPMPGSGITAYEEGKSLTTFLDGLATNAKTKRLVVCIALSDADNYEEVTQQIRQWYETLGSKLELQVILSDTALDDEVVQNENLYFNYGVSPTASSKYGFPQSFEARFGRSLKFGEARIYDALAMVALGAAHQRVNGEKCSVAGREVKYYEKPFGPTLTDHMRSVVSSDAGVSCGWEAEGLARAFSEIAAGRSVHVTGASGSLNFDNESYTKVLGTDYIFWTIDTKKGRSVKPILHISTESSNTQASTKSLWELDKMWAPEYEDVAVHHNLPAVTDRWAVVVSPSTTWSNYRHQADAFAMYQLLRQHGYDDDHIVLIVEDNLANDSRNVFPGQIFVERSSDPAAVNDQFVNEDVRKGAVVDYHFSDLELTDLADIMTGRSSSRLPQVIHPTVSSDIFFFWSGHGGSEEGPLWGNEDAEDYFGKDRIRNIVKELVGTDAASRRYRRMMFAIETCFSGHWGDALMGQPDVLVLTAANEHESSKADAHDRELGVYLSNAFARTFRRQIDANNEICIKDLYNELFKTTKGSHVSIYNQKEYGSVYSEKMSEFLPR